MPGAVEEDYLKSCGARSSRRVQQEQQESAEIETPYINKGKAGHPQNEPEDAQELTQGVKE